MKTAEMFRTVGIAKTLASIACIAAMTACGGAPSGSKQQLSARNVRTAAVERGAQGAAQEVPGTVRSGLRASIEAKVSGRIERLAITEGQQVREGDLLCELDVRELKAKLDQASATADEAKREMTRKANLLARGAAPRAEFEAAEARARVAEAAVVETQTMLGYAKVTAPFNGIVARKLTNVGDFASPGRALFEVEDPATLRLEANVPEALISGVKIGGEYEVRIPGLAAAVKGAVAEVAPVADPNSRTYLVKLNLPLDPALRSGQFGRALLPSSEEVLSVPSTALIARGQLEMVFVVSEGRAWMRLVRSGRRYGERVEILSGVEPGEQVVISDTAAMADGERVEVAA